MEPNWLYPRLVCYSAVKNVTVDDKIVNWICDNVTTFEASWVLDITANLYLLAYYSFSVNQTENKLQFRSPFSE